MCNQVLKSKAIQTANVFSIQCNKLAMLLFKPHTSRFLVTTDRSFAVLCEKPFSVLSSELLSYLVCCLSSVLRLSDYMLSPTATHAARRFLLPAVQEAAEDSRFEVSLTLSGTFFTLLTRRGQVGSEVRCNHLSCSTMDLGTKPAIGNK